jgi:hypothetical protein
MQPPVITALRFSPDGSTIAVSGNREILLHKADGRALLKRLPGKAERLLSVAFSNDGKLLIAGGGTPGDGLGDNGPARQARLGLPEGVAIDANQNLYITDAELHRVRRVSPDGIITTVAGTGFGGFNGDFGPATQAQLNAPRAVALDPAGNLYIADSANHRVQKFTRREPLGYAQQNAKNEHSRQFLAQAK